MFFFNVLLFSFRVPFMQPLKIIGRVLVGEGVLTKMCRKRPKARQFFLFNDILVYGNIVISKKKYNKQHIIPLEEVQLQGLEDSGRMYSIFFNKSIQYQIKEFSFILSKTQKIKMDGSSEQQQNRLPYMQQPVQKNRNGWHILINAQKIC